MKSIRIGIKDLVTHLYSDADLTNEFSFNHALEEGKKAHLFLQNKYNKNTTSEVYVKKELIIDDYNILITGYIDGLIIEDRIIIEEIKSTSLELDFITEEYHPEYLAQLKMYMSIIADEKKIDMIEGQLTYINTRSYKLKKYNYIFSKEELDLFFTESLNRYINWIKLLDQAKELRKTTIKNMEFPFNEFRKGQRALMNAVYETLREEDILYALAPTGVGKTISTLYSALKSLSDDQEIIFYATSKSLIKNIAQETLINLNNRGLRCKCIIITSKEKSCFKKMGICDSNECVYAHKFFKKLSIATEDIFAKYDIFTPDLIFQYAKWYELCPFEFSLHLSLFCDVIICDYNYIFDPQNHLIRFFDDAPFKPKLLIDEAHNLINRSLDMYSAIIYSKDILLLKKYFRGKKPSINSTIKKFQKYIDNINLEEKEKAFIELNEEFIFLCQDLFSKASDIFADNLEFNNRDMALEIFFQIKSFLKIAEYYDNSRRFIIRVEEEGLSFQILCLNAAINIIDTLENKTYGSILFSATLFPLPYYKELITMNKGNHLLLPSPFPEENLKVILMNNISTFYKDRHLSVDRIIDVILTLIKAKKGNYIIFFPSYAYLDLVVSKMPQIDNEIIIQNRDLNELERIEIIEKFNEKSNPVLGFFVTGGIFSEGIDYIGDKLSGVIVVGAGLPQINFVNELSKDYFDTVFQEGFNYAYTYPGFNKIVQAAGRVIRSNEDRGVVILIDPRMTSPIYRKMMPSSWKNLQKCYNITDLEKSITDFWQ